MAPPGFGIGTRLSFSSALCTVWYVGSVDGTDGEWLGVEWDDFSKGKHDGSREGTRYFKCLSRSTTAASFIRPSRKPDPERTFLEAIYHKYATEDASTSQSGPFPPEREIIISGKVAEEVGFDKIRKQQSQLQELKIVIVDGLCIKHARKLGENIRETCPSILELDLSRNLFETFEEVVDICKELPFLRKLRLNGNRFMDLILNSKQTPSGSHHSAFPAVIELELDETSLPWKALMAIRSHFPILERIEASSNCLHKLENLQITTLPVPLSHLDVSATHSLTASLKSITLEYNTFESIGDLEPLALLKNLEVLRLKGNKICRLGASSTGQLFMFASSLHYLDISYNFVDSWDFVDGLPQVFPGLTALRFSHNPVYDSGANTTDAKGSEEGYMVTTARLGKLKILNFGNITTADRTNAETYYLSKIGKELAEVSHGNEDSVISRHPRYTELCGIYDAPIIARKEAGGINPAFLEARLISFTCHLSRRLSKAEERSIEIPRSFDVYRTKGLIGELFEIQPWKLRLIWETGEWDPVAGYEDDEIDSEDDDEVEQLQLVSDRLPNATRKGKWVQREVEIEDSTRQIGNCIDGSQAKVRVERRG